MNRVYSQADSIRAVDAFEAVASNPEASEQERKAARIKLLEYMYTNLVPSRLYTRFSAELAKFFEKTDFSR